MVKINHIGAPIAQPAGNNAPAAPAVPAAPPAPVQPPANLAAAAGKAHKASGHPADDEVWQIIKGAMAVVDEVRRIQAGFGPDAAKLAADQASISAYRAVEDGMKKLSWNRSGLRIAATACACILSAFFGWVLHSAMDVNTPIGPMPREMAETMHLQDWGKQWDACKRQAPVDGHSWCLLPYVTAAPVGPDGITAYRR